jgi:carbon storage regulator
MLVLSRKVGESIVIGGNITVTVMSIDRYKVRIGVEAPKELPVHRDEIQQRIRDGVPRKPKPESTICSLCLGGKEPDEEICENCRCAAECVADAQGLGD